MKEMHIRDCGKLFKKYIQQEKSVDFMGVLYQLAGLMNVTGGLFVFPESFADVQFIPYFHKIGCWIPKAWVLS